MEAPLVKIYYGKPLLPDVSRVLACLYEKEVSFKLMDIHEGQHIIPSDNTKLQASARLHVPPAYEDGTTTLFESRAICRHVAEKYAEQGNRYLLGRDVLDRASIEQWLKLEEQSFDPPSRKLVFHLAFSPEYGTGEAERTLGKVLDVYEQRLGESMFLAGDEFTLADLSHLPNSHYLVNAERYRYMFEGRKNVRKWWMTVSERPSWKKVVEVLNQVEIGEEHERSSELTRSSSSATKNFLVPQLSSLSVAPEGPVRGDAAASANPRVESSSMETQGDDAAHGGTDEATVVLLLDSDEKLTSSQESAMQAMQLKHSGQETERGDACDINGEGLFLAPKIEEEEESSQETKPQPAHQFTRPQIENQDHKAAAHTDVQEPLIPESSSMSTMAAPSAPQQDTAEKINGSKEVMDPAIASAKEEKKGKDSTQGDVPADSPSEQLADAQQDMLLESPTVSTMEPNPVGE